MGRHDERAHLLHIPKQVKFKQPKPALPMKRPQQPLTGTGSKNQFRIVR